ncbi:hypothetical protein PYH37_005500 [Sinorhizobium numidicum]|uniref:Fibrinogen-binding protein n=1 Tax=Sinorhizobium numidicum TaxID=680248 RepID=A0ABY8D2L3_9HYPH|nr:hypothetical protein [Sinorhizobium numidicum]WEX77126.1 hypothetical protein PYH37_005500 [Sinorhizobium numidicum]WEX83785.1 hypothetical protein PYH38_002593 [Sinorhizobium numidicum]
MPGSSQRNLGLHDNLSADDDLKVGALVDGLATGSHHKGVDDSTLHHPETAAGDNKNKADDGTETADTQIADVESPGTVGGDLAFNLPDDFSLTLSVDHLLTSASADSGDGTGFSVEQANSLADQEQVHDARVNSDGGTHPDATGGDADGCNNLNSDTAWDLKGDEDAGSSIDPSTLLASSGFHHEIVQGANLLSKVVDASVVGGDPNLTSVGPDSDVD